MFFGGDNPLVMCSGWSVKALRKQGAFFSRYSRTMNGSKDRAVTLLSFGSQPQDMMNLSACRTITPVIKWVGMSDCNISTTRIPAVTEIKPPVLYSCCLHQTSARPCVQVAGTRLSLLLTSYPTTCNPGFLQPIIPSSSPMATSSSGEAFTRKTRL
jgi:hypothetical protein